ncbi:MAG: ATP synthase F1 subunit gamma [Proteobacteria bacterium]|nr:ATP synthase F1 subunit gamma [Pseudomonadota bacterium]
MSGLKQIRKRIASVKSTQKITRAMKMVAAARLRRAQQAITQLRPYALETLDVLSSLASRSEGELAHPLLERREINKVLLVALTSDRGLAGSFNANVNKHAHRYAWELEEQGAEVSIGTIGRKSRDYFRRRGVTSRHEFTGVFENLNLEKAREIGAVIIDEYTRSELDAVYLVYNEFKSAISQTVVMEPLLPIKPMEAQDDDLVDFVYEPGRRALLDRLLPMYVEVEVYRALLESVASEHGARMTAMDAATKNAAEMIAKLTLQFNRARQAAITKELMEIIGGAEALKN